jgi:pentatricopeptide repeat protein
MYAKGGELERAKDIFSTMLGTRKSKMTVIDWTAMISAYAQFGHGKMALELFEIMVSAGVKPNHQSIACVLNGCSHAGLVAEAVHLFNSMKTRFDIDPDEMHYNSLVDTLSRAGILYEAENIIESMKTQNATAWRAFLGGCRKYMDIPRAEKAARVIAALDPSDASPYVILSTIYKITGDKEKRAKIQDLMRKVGAKKVPGVSRVEVNGTIHSFVSEDDSHEDIKEIYHELSVLNREMMEAGYIPDTSLVTRELETEEEKLTAISLHSEKIALAFALKQTPPYTIIRLVNNLRICGDCHNATMFISKIKQRKIIVRDANRFHVFENGTCSCGMYW